MMDIIDTDKLEGKLYFIAKIKSPKDRMFNIYMKKVQGGGHDIPTIELVDKRDIYYLYRINITSQIRVFNINLEFDGATTLTSRNYNFGVEKI